MLNSISDYSTAGTKAGRAQNVGDAATVRHWREHFQRMRDLERTPEDKTAARDAYDNAYRIERQKNAGRYR